MSKFTEEFDKYNTPNPQSDIELKSPAMGMTVRVPIVDSFTQEPNINSRTNVYIDNKPMGILTGLQPGEVCLDSSSGNLIVGTTSSGPAFAPLSVDDMDDLFGSIAVDTDSTRRVTTTTSYIQSTRTHELPKDLNTRDLMFIKDKIEDGYSYIKIKNLDELKQAFKRLGCYISDSDVSTLATIGVFKLECGKYAIIN